MNESIQQLIDRKSVRAFTDQDISEEDSQLILTAAVNAPTAGNQQLYTILNITDPSIKKQLADSCDHQPFIAKVPMVRAEADPESSGPCFFLPHFWYSDIRLISKRQERNRSVQNSRTLYRKIPATEETVASFQRC